MHAVNIQTKIVIYNKIQRKALDPAYNSFFIQIIEILKLNQILKFTEVKNRNKTRSGIQ